MRYLIGLAIAPVVFLSVSIFGTQIHVPQDYPTIQMGIDSAMAGDSVVVANGIYYEHLVIDKAISMIGEHRDYTIINGAGVGDIVKVTADSALIEYFTICQSGLEDTNSAIKFLSGHDAEVRGCIIRHNYNGVIFCGGAYECLRFCDIDSNVVGVRFRKNSQIVGITNRCDLISCNFIQDNSEAGVIFDSTNTTSHQSDNIQANRIKNNGIGINMSSSQYNYVLFNEFIDNDSFAVIISNCTDSAVANIVGVNNFFDNNHTQVQAYDLCGNNQWVFFDHNYWSDYRGVDSDSNHYGDTPYYLAGGLASENTPCMDPLRPYFWGITFTGNSVRLAGVDIHVIGTSIQVFSNDSGFFTLEGWGSGHWDLLFHKDGYRDTIIEDIGIAIGCISSIAVIMRPISAIDNTNEGAVSNYLQLLPCYPNPFNSSTNIRFEIPSRADVKIDIYNILGQRLKNLFGGVLAAGTHSILFDASDYPSGIYFCRMESGGKSLVQKLQLIK